MVVVSCGQMIIICNLSGGLPTNKSMGRVARKVASCSRPLLFFTGRNPCLYSIVQACPAIFMPGFSNHSSLPSHAGWTGCPRELIATISPSGHAAPWQPLLAFPDPVALTHLLACLQDAKHLQLPASFLINFACGIYQEFTNHNHVWSLLNDLILA